LIHLRSQLRITFWKKKTGGKDEICRMQIMGDQKIYAVLQRQPLRLLWHLAHGQVRSLRCRLERMRGLRSPG
jgi:hypothetical protein